MTCFKMEAEPMLAVPLLVDSRILDCVRAPGMVSTWTRGMAALASRRLVVSAIMHWPGVAPVWYILPGGALDASF